MLHDLIETRTEVQLISTIKTIFAAQTDETSDMPAMMAGRITQNIAKNIMSVSEVTRLRKVGKLQEAYDLAREELEECQDKWTSTSMFWVLRDMIQKVYLPANNIDAAQESLDKMKEFYYDGWMDYNEAAERAYKSLCRFVRPNGYEVKSASELSKTDPDGAYQKVTEMYGKDAKLLDDKLHEEFGWILYRYMKANFDRLTSVQIRCLLRDYMLLHNERPSMLHSTILGFALKFHKNHPDFSFYKFFLLWGPENLRDEDFEDKTYYVDTEVVHEGEGNASLGDLLPDISEVLKEIFEEPDENIETSSDVEGSAESPVVVEDHVDSPDMAESPMELSDTVEIPTEPSGAEENTVESPINSEKDGVSCSDSESQTTPPSDYEEENYYRPHIERHDIPSLISRICKAIWYSGEAFDVYGLVTRFADKHKHIVAETMRQLYFWKLIGLYKEDKQEALFHAFTDYAEQYPGLGPSHWHTEILKLAYRLMTEDHSADFVPFMMKWDGSGNLTETEWSMEVSKKGTYYKALAIRCAKKCFSIIKDTPKDMVSDATLAWMKGLYKKVTEKEPDDEWALRNYATICVWRGETEEAIDLYKSLLVRMDRTYYLWAELASLLHDNNDIAIGLLLKAKELEKNEDFLGGIHLSLASLLLKEGYVAAATKEMAAYEAHRKEMGWSISDDFYALQAQASACEDKGGLVDAEAYIDRAEDFVYDKLDWIDFVITDKWVKDKVERCGLTDGNGVCISTQTNRFRALKGAKAGDIIQLKCKKEKEIGVGSCDGRLKAIIIEKNTPIMARKADADAWSILPARYGVVDYVNEEKKVLHIIDSESEQVFHKYKGKPLPADSFVRFREYSDKRKEEERICVAGVEPCPPDEALQHMRQRIVVVDDVNEAKKLFHVVLGKGKVSDVVRFDQTDIRPKIGDFLHVTYCIKKNKEGKKRIKFLDVQRSTEACKGLTDTVWGELRVTCREEGGEPDFAFVDDHYVHRNVLKKCGIRRDCDVTAKLVLGGDDKWKVYDLVVDSWNL